MISRKLLSENVGARNHENSDEYSVSNYGYGKDYVKILHVNRNGLVHTVNEFEVSTHLKLESKKDWFKGDNQDIIATDTQKNTVYLLAKKFGIKSPEDFATLLCNHFLKQYNHIVSVSIHIEVYPWDRIQYEGSDKPHNHAFVFAPIATRFCDVIRNRIDFNPTVISGLKNLRVLKTTQSKFVDFHRDEFRSLPDFEDRVFSTIASSHWQYNSVHNVDYSKVWNQVKEIILYNFAGEPVKGMMSPSVQNTLYLSEKEILDKIPQVSSVVMEMPNKHYYSVDFSKFPKLVQGENQEVFLPVDAPYGIMHAQLDRKQITSKL